MIGKKVALHPVQKWQYSFTSGTLRVSTGDLGYSVGNRSNGEADYALLPRDFLKAFLDSSYDQSQRCKSRFLIKECAVIGVEIVPNISLICPPRDPLKALPDSCYDQDRER